MDAKEALNRVVKETAKELSANIPNDLVTALLSAAIEDALSDIGKSWGPGNVKNIVEDAVAKRVDRILEGSPEFSKRVDDLAASLANEALVIAKNDLSLRKRRR
jgi:hypothetical protein